MHTTIRSSVSRLRVDTARGDTTTSATSNPQDTDALWATRDLARFIGCSER